MNIWMGLFSKVITLFSIGQVFCESRNYVFIALLIKESDLRFFNFYQYRLWKTVKLYFLLCSEYKNCLNWLFSHANSLSVCTNSIFINLDDIVYISSCSVKLRSESISYDCERVCTHILGMFLAQFCWVFMTLTHSPKMSPKLVPYCALTNNYVYHFYSF